MPAAEVPDVRPGPILAIDTASAQGGIAWYDGRRLSLRSWPAERAHTTTLLAEIHHLLASDGLALGDIAAVAVAIGPGAFTGLRAGLGAAKGFHLAVGVPLIGVSTLEATALPFATCGLSIVATVPAGRGRMVWAQYRVEGAEVVETQPPRNGTLDELIEALAASGGAIVAGEMGAEQAAAIAAVEGAVVPPTPLRFRLASGMAEIGWRRWLAGRVDNATTLEPIYLSR